MKRSVPHSDEQFEYKDVVVQDSYEIAVPYIDWYHFYYLMYLNIIMYLHIYIQNLIFQQYPSDLCRNS